MITEDVLDEIVRNIAAFHQNEPTGIPGERWVWINGERFLITVQHDPPPASDEEIERSFDAYR